MKKIYAGEGFDGYIVKPVNAGELENELIRLLPKELVTLTKSDDDIIEALEYPDNRFNIGVQWHPERLDDNESNNLWSAFINSCKK